MSISPLDYEQDEAYAAFYEEHFEQAVEEFTTELLQSYYREHRDVVQPALQALREANTQRTSSPTASFLFAAIALEVGVKEALLRPVVHGLIHNDAAAELVTTLVIRQHRFDGFQGNLLTLLSEYGGVDLTAYQRPGSTKALWEEIKTVQKTRNLIVHRGHRVGSPETDQALGVASCVLEIILPKVLDALGLCLRADDNIKSKYGAW